MAVYVRYAGDGPRFGELVGDMIHPLTGAPGSFAPSGEAPVATASVRRLNCHCERKKQATEKTATNSSQTSQRFQFSSKFIRSSPNQ